jgi:hypothetical protein
MKKTWSDQALSLSFWGDFCQMSQIHQDCFHQTH